MSAQGDEAIRQLDMLTYRTVGAISGLMLSVQDGTISAERAWERVGELLGEQQSESNRVRAMIAAEVKAWDMVVPIRVLTVEEVLEKYGTEGQ